MGRCRYESTSIRLVVPGCGMQALSEIDTLHGKIESNGATGSDPVKVGLVESLNRPGENITGVTFLLNTLGPKVLQILYSLQPKSKRVAVLLNPNLATTASQTRDVEDAGKALGLEIQIFMPARTAISRGYLHRLIKCEQVEC